MRPRGCSQITSIIVDKLSHKIAAAWITLYFEFGGIKWQPHDFSRGFLCTPDILCLCTTSFSRKCKYSLKLSLRQSVTPNVGMKTIFHFEIDSHRQNRVRASHCRRSVGPYGYLERV